MVTIRQVLLLAGVVVVGLLGWRFYDHAYSAGMAECIAARTALADAAADRARAQAEARSDRQREEARTAAAARFDQLRRRHALELDLARRLPGPDCGLDDQSLRLLNDAVRAGNAGSTATPGGVPGGVPAGAGAD